MAKENTKKELPENNPMDNGINYASKPSRIGPVLKEYCKEMGLKPKEIAKQLKIDFRSVYAIFRQKEMMPGKMMKWSVLLKRNLFNEYIPNLLPEANPLQAALDEANRKLAEIPKLQAEIERLKEKVIEVEAERDYADRKLDKFLMRK